MVREKSFYSSIFRIAAPSALQALIGFLVVLVDDMMVSSIADYGKAAHAAVSQINAITAFFTATVLGFASGSSVLISQYWGKKDVSAIRRVFSVVAAVCALVAVIFTVAALVAPGWVASMVIKSSGGDSYQLAIEYLQIVCLSYIPYAICYALVAMLRSVEVVRVTLYITIASLIINISLNYVLIFGKLGFPPLGVRGAAIATVISRVAELAIVWWYAFYRQKVITVAPRDLIKFNKPMARDYAKYGVPVGATDAQWALIGLMKAAIIGRLGDAFIDANSITSSMMNLGTMFTFALAGGACVMVGKAVGAGDYAKAREYSKTIQIMFALIGVFMGLMTFALAKPFTSLYGSASEAEVFNLAVKMIIVGACTVPLTSYHASCFVGINRGAGDSRFVALVDMICGWLIVLPATYLAAIVFEWDLWVVFLMTRIDQCFKWIIAFIRLRGNKWIKNVTREI